MKKIRNIEREVVEKLNDLTGNEGNFSFNFNAHEETIDQLQGTMEAIEKDFISYKERMTNDCSNAVDLCKRTREDYVQRMKEIYDDHNNMVDDTKRVIEVLKTRYDNQFAEFKVQLSDEREKRKEFIEKAKQEMIKSLEDV